MAAVRIGLSVGCPCPCLVDVRADRDGGAGYNIKHSGRGESPDGHFHFDDRAPAGIGLERDLSQLPKFPGFRFRQRRERHLEPEAAKAPQLTTIAQQSFPAAGVTRPSVLFIVEQLAMRQGLAIACRFEPRCYNRGSWRHRPHPGDCDHAAIRRFQTAMSAVTAPSAVGWMIA